MDSESSHVGVEHQENAAMRPASSAHFASAFRHYTAGTWIQLSFLLLLLPDYTHA